MYGYICMDIYVYKMQFADALGAQAPLGFWDPLGIYIYIYVLVRVEMYGYICMDVYIFIYISP
jgi:hypothetical protein